jgi:excisionase family DNA binding protein
MMTQEYLTTAEAAARLRVADETVRVWLRTGKLAGTRLNRRAGYRIPASEVERLLQGHPRPAAADTEEGPR